MGFLFFLTELDMGFLTVMIISYILFMLKLSLISFIIHAFEYVYIVLCETSFAIKMFLFILVN